MDEQDRPWADPTYSEQPRMPWWRDRFKLAVSVGAGISTVIAAVLVVVFLTSGRGTAVVATGSTGASASASASEMPTTGPSQTATPQASATATPGGPTAGQQVLEPGWGRADTTLNLRYGPGTDSPIQSRVLRGTVLMIVDGPEARDGYDWYFAQLIDHNQGWFASGPASDPFVSVLGTGLTFEACGEVTSNGNKVDGLRIGSSDLVTDSMFELAAATDGQACVIFGSRDNSFPWRYLSLILETCARPVFGPAGYFGFKPTTAGDVSEDVRLKRRVDIPNAFFDEGVDMEGVEYSNRWAVFLAGKNGADPLACVSARLNEDPETYQRELVAHLADCFTILSNEADLIKVKPAATTSYFVFIPPEDSSIDPVTIGDARRIELVAGSRDSEQYLSLTDMGAC
jgi:hypothetical protein